MIFMIFQVFLGIFDTFFQWNQKQDMSQATCVCFIL